MEFHTVVENFTPVPKLYFSFSGSPNDYEMHVMCNLTGFVNNLA